MCYIKGHIDFLPLEKMDRFSFVDCLWANTHKSIFGLEKKFTCLFVNENFNLTSYCCVYMGDHGHAHT